MTKLDRPVIRQVGNMVVELHPATLDEGPYLTVRLKWGRAHHRIGLKRLFDMLADQAITNAGGRVE